MDQHHLFGGGQGGEEGVVLAGTMFVAGREPGTGGHAAVVGQEGVNRRTGRQRALGQAENHNEVDVQAGGLIDAGD